MSKYLLIAMRICLLCSLVACSDVSFPSELVHFIPYARNPVMLPSGPGTWESWLRERAAILHEGSTYEIWYTACVAPGMSAPCELGYAESSDGISWQRNPNNPIYKESWVESPTVIKHDGAYFMFSEGVECEAQLHTSIDRLRWTRVGPLDIRYTNGSQLTPGPYGTPTVWFENGVGYLFYERLDDAIWLARSTDMQVWTNVQDDPILTIGPYSYDEVRMSPDEVIRYQGRYYLYYNGEGKAQRWSVNVASSEDLIHWTKYGGNPLVDGASDGILVEDGARFRLYTTAERVDLWLGE